MNHQNQTQDASAELADILRKDLVNYSKHNEDAYRHLSLIHHSDQLTMRTARNDEEDVDTAYLRDIVEDQKQFGDYGTGRIFLAVS
jgi:hypothetical protein